MAKVRIQARSSEGDTEEENGLPHGSRPPAKAKQTGAVGLLIRVLKTEGFAGWYQVRRISIVQDQRSNPVAHVCIQQGMSAQIIKAVLSQALLFVSKEQFERWALTLMIFLSKLRTTP